MFSISKRAAVLGGKAKADSKEAKDGSEATWLTFELEELKIDANELAALLREPHAFEALYNTGANPIEPYLRGLKSLELSDSIADAYVRIDVGLTGFTRFDFKGCKLSKIKLQLRQGGDTALSCKVTVQPNLDAKLATLLEFLGATVQAELRGEAPGAQVDLPLNSFTDGGEQEPMSNTGRQIQASAARAERKKRADAARKDVN
jgi:hypothetical protein